MRVKRILGMFLAMALATAFPSDLMAGQEEEEKFELEKIIVTEERDPVPGYEKTVVSEEDVNRPSFGGSVVEALKNEAGIQFMRTTPTTGNDIRMRGFDESRLLIEMDGVPMNLDGSYGGDAMNWDAMSTDQVERIEIQRGAVSAKYGNTLGGVIDIVKKKPSDKPKTSVSSTLGKFDTWNTQLSHSARAGMFWWNIDGSHFETDGYLRNNYSDRNNINLKIGMDLPQNWEIGAGYEYSDAEAGLIVDNDPASPYYDDSYPISDGGSMGGPGTRMTGTPGDDSYKDDTSNAVTAFVGKKLENGDIKVKFRLWNRERTEYYYDIEAPHTKIYERETEIEDNNWLINLNASHTLKDHLIEWGGEHKRYGWGDQTVPYIDMNYFNAAVVSTYYYIAEGFEGQPKNKKYTALYLQDTWKFHPDWELELGLRQEWFKTDEVDPEAFGFDWDTEEDVIDVDHLDPRGALTWRPWDGGSISARMGIVHRYPTSPESFWWYLNKGTQFFNTTLEPEEAVQYELGIEQKIFSRALLTLRGYYYDIEHYITGTTVRGYGRVVYNIDDVTIKGWESELSVNILKNLRVWANFTWQDGKKSGDPYDAENDLGNQLSDVPAIMYNLGLDYRTDRLLVKLALNHMGDRDRFEEGDVETLGSYSLANFYAAYKFWKTDKVEWQAMLSIDNILDEDYKESDGYPMAGTSAIGGLKATF